MMRIVKKIRGSMVPSEYNPEEFKVSVAKWNIVGGLLESTYFSIVHLAECRVDSLPSK